MTRLSLLLASVALSALAGCANLTTGTDQVVEVSTDPPMAASCLVSNGSYSASIFATPQHVDIEKAPGPLSVTCRTPDGWYGHVTVDGHIKSLAGAYQEAGSAVSRVAVGGVAGDDIAEGTTNSFFGSGAEWPPHIVVPMAQTNAPLQLANGFPSEPPPPPPARPVYRKPSIHHAVRKAPPTHCHCGS